MRELDPDDYMVLVELLTADTKATNPDGDESDEQIEEPAPDHE